MNKLIPILLILLFFTAVKHPAVRGEGYNVYNSGEYSAKSVMPDERIMFIVDFSNSMAEKIDGKKKIDIATETMERILPQIPRSTYLGMRVYGHRHGFSYIDSCRASKLANRPAPDNSRLIQASLYNYSPRGATPITYSLKQTVLKDFGAYTGKKRIILLSDGGENCDESPCDFALDLIKKRSDYRIDVIALDVDEAAINQLKCVALATSGKFYSAKTAAELLNSFEDSLNIQKEVQGVVIP